MKKICLILLMAGLIAPSVGSGANTSRWFTLPACIDSHCGEVGGVCGSCSMQVEVIKSSQDSLRFKLGFRDAFPPYKIIQETEEFIQDATDAVYDVKELIPDFAGCIHDCLLEVTFIGENPRTSSSIAVVTIKGPDGQGPPSSYLRITPIKINPITTIRIR